MTREELIASLHGMQPPEPISLWPLAPGWWWLGGGGLLGLLLIGGLAGYVYHRRHRRRALRRLRQLYATPPRDDVERARELARLNDLLRDLTLALDPTRAGAGRAGLAWLHFLDHALEPGAFSRGAGQCLLEGPYQPAVPAEAVDRDALYHLIRRWIRRARPGVD